MNFLINHFGEILVFLGVVIPSFLIHRKNQKSREEMEIAHAEERRKGDKQIVDQYAKYAELVDERAKEEREYAQEMQAKSDLKIQELLEEIQGLKKEIEKLEKKINQCNGK